LTTFYTEKCLPILREKLPEIEQESERQTKSELTQPKNSLKCQNWMKILLIAILAFSGSFSTFTLARSCAFKSCGSDPFAFCSFEFLNFYSTCECQNGFNWHENQCFICLVDNECPANLPNQVCYDHKCFENENVFTCNDRSKTMFSLHRCDGIKDCEDGSDETYHCGKKYSNICDLNI
jgi:hypothetical protein